MLTLIAALDVHAREFVSSVQGRDEGAGIVEYLLLVLFIALVLFVSLTFFSGSLSGAFSRAGNSVPA